LKLMEWSLPFQTSRLLLHNKTTAPSKKDSSSQDDLVRCSKKKSLVEFISFPRCKIKNKLYVTSRFRDAIITFQTYQNG
jgi:hypothetical protein